MAGRRGHWSGEGVVRPRRVPLCRRGCCWDWKGAVGHGRGHWASLGRTGGCWAGEGHQARKEAIGREKGPLVRRGGRQEPLGRRGCCWDRKGAVGHGRGLLGIIRQERGRQARNKAVGQEKGPLGRRGGCWPRNMG